MVAGDVAQVVVFDQAAHLPGAQVAHRTVHHADKDSYATITNPQP